MSFTPDELDFRLDEDYLALMKRWTPRYPTESLRLKRKAK